MTEIFCSTRVAVGHGDEGRVRVGCSVPDIAVSGLLEIFAVALGLEPQALQRHRVLPPSPDAPDEELLSLIFFHQADHDAVITPLTDAAGIDAEPVVSGDYLRNKLAKLDIG